jgi:Fe-S cluster assembly protein SufB
MIHLAPYTSSSIVSKSIARGGGRTSYRGEIRVNPGAHHSANTVRCDALLVDTISRSDTYPSVDVREDDVSMGHEATVSRVSEEQLFYLQQRGISLESAIALIISGFCKDVFKELPGEFAAEANQLMSLKLENSVG